MTASRPLLPSVLEQRPRLYAEGLAEPFQRRDLNALEGFSGQDARRDWRRQAGVDGELVGVLPAPFGHMASDDFRVPSNHGLMVASNVTIDKVVTLAYNSSVPKQECEMVAAVEQVEAILPDGASQVMQLDDYGMCAHFEVDVTFSRHGVHVRGTRAALLDLAEAFEDRADRNGGWDQPNWYFRSAAIAARKLRVAAAGRSANA